MPSILYMVSAVGPSECVTARTWRPGCSAAGVSKSTFRTVRISVMPMVAVDDFLLRGSEEIGMDAIVIGQGNGLGEERYVSA